MFVPAPGPDSQAARALATEHGGALTGANGKAEEAAPSEAATEPGTTPDAGPATA